MSEVLDTAGGCKKCHGTWPQVTFREMARAISTGADIKEVICDSCQANRVGQIAEKIGEVQSEARITLIREVRVSGIVSKTNLSAFTYTTHRGLWEGSHSDVLVEFKKESADVLPDSIYLFKNVPVTVCEAWYAAPSKGGYFIQFIKNSYSSEKVK